MRNGLRVLVAEDNPTNQMVVVEILKKQGIATIVVAENGRQAVEQYRQQVFDLVLMDVRMPQMDGLQATAAIRELECTSGRRTPIVALTAHAMKKDEAACLASGMDAHVSKPLNLKKFFRIMDDLLGGRFASQAQMSGAAVNEGAVMDLQSMIEFIGEDKKILNKIMQSFLDSYQAMLDRVQDTVRARDALQMVEAAHALKSAVNNFGAERTAREANALESLGESGELDGCDSILKKLEQEMSLFVEALEREVMSHGL